MMSLRAFTGLFVPLLCLEQKNTVGNDTTISELKNKGGELDRPKHM